MFQPNHVGRISSKIAEIVVVVVAHPLPILAPKIFQDVRASEVETAFLLTKISPHVGNKQNSKVARDKHIYVGLTRNKIFTHT